jgi:hypothetical protein
LHSEKRGKATVIAELAATSHFFTAIHNLNDAKFSTPNEITKYIISQNLPQNPDNLKAQVHTALKRDVEYYILKRCKDQYRFEAFIKKPITRSHFVGGVLEGVCALIAKVEGPTKGALEGVATAAEGGEAAAGGVLGRGEGVLLEATVANSWPDWHRTVQHPVVWGSSRTQ